MKRRGLEDPVLNESEAKANREVAKVYCLQRADFPTEEEYDNFLEEREDLIFARVHKINEGAATETIAAFQKKHKIVIEGRTAENMEKSHEKKSFSLPLLTQLQFQTPVNLLSSSKMAIRSIQYSDASFSLEVQQRGEKWEENANVTVTEAGGMLESWRLIKAKQELASSLSLIG
jgi:hypothetical protein